MPIPIGQELISTDIASSRSRPSNRSVTIFVTSTFRITAPMPLTKRATLAAANDSASARPAPPIAISARPTSTSRLSPKRRPSKPPGSANATPGNRYKPISQPSCVLSSPSPSTIGGPTAASDWNWKPIAARATVRADKHRQRGLNGWSSGGRGRPARACCSRPSGRPGSWPTRPKHPCVRMPRGRSKAAKRRVAHVAQVGAHLAEAALLREQRSASSSEMNGSTTVSSPGRQFAGVATRCFADSCSASSTRRISSKLRPI
jgi:hypothetical protein